MVSKEWFARSAIQSQPRRVACWILAAVAITIANGWAERTSLAQGPPRPVLIDAPPLIPIPPLARTDIPIAPPIPTPRAARFAPAPLDAASVAPTLPPSYAPATTWGQATQASGQVLAAQPAAAFSLAAPQVCPCCGNDRALAYRQAVPAYGVPAYGVPMQGASPYGMPMALYQPVPITSWKPATATNPANSRYYVGRGVLGQPKIFVNGQPVRNAFRALSP